MSQQIEVVRAACEAFIRGDLDAISRLHHPAIEWKTSSEERYLRPLFADVPAVPDLPPVVRGSYFQSFKSRTYRGPADVRSYFEQWLAAFAAFKADLEECFEVSENRVFATIRYVMWLGLQGGEVEWRVSHVYELSEGLIIRAEEYFDPAEILQRIGGTRAEEARNTVLDRQLAELRDQIARQASHVEYLHSNEYWQEEIDSPGPPNRDTPREAMEQLNSLMREEAALLARYPTSDLITPLVAGLGHESASVRHNAANALGKLGDPRAIEPLVRVVDDEATLVRQAAAEALSRLGTEEALSGVGGRERAKARAAIASRRAEADGRQLQELVEDGDVDALIDMLRVAFLQRDRKTADKATAALATIDPAHHAALLASLRDEDTLVRWAVAHVLGEIGNLDAVPALRIALDDPDDGVREAAGVALERIESRHSG